MMIPKIAFEENSSFYSLKYQKKNLGEVWFQKLRLGVGAEISQAWKNQYLGRCRCHDDDFLKQLGYAV